MADDAAATDQGQKAERNETLDLIYSGCMDNLPAMSSKIVRIFTSSTFTDTALERNSLMAGVYPRLKDYCREKHGLEFQVVDMRWGVRDEATDDHMTADLCMNEIDNCQRLSVGPNFVVFLGQKYGYRPQPTRIVYNELELILSACPTDAERELLTTWYKRDENAVPATYILQPVSSIYLNFTNKKNQKKMQEDQNKWWETMGKLCKTLRLAASELLKRNQFTADDVHRYNLSVTEQEIVRGILKAKDNIHHTLGFVRIIKDINVQALRYSRNFIDILGRDVDREAQDLLDKLRDTKVPAKLPVENTLRFEVPWSDKEGLNDEEHGEYLKKFCVHFYERIVDLIDRGVLRQRQLSNDRVYSECLQHLHACSTFCRVFQGREEILGQIQEYFENDERNQPLVLWGEGGCGKTSLLAKTASMRFLNHQEGVRPMAIVRFLGTSPDSSRIVPLMTSILQQLTYLFDLPRTEFPLELAQLSNHLKTMMEMATAERPLGIFLDSLDQLSSADGAHSLAWLPLYLPPHVKIVISTLPNYYGLIETLRNLIEDRQQFLQVTPLGKELGATVLEVMLRMRDRSITPPQWEVVNSALALCNLPLFVKLVFDDITRWKSYTKDMVLAKNISDSIYKLLNRIELQHGQILVVNALSYITASKSGISESELEDLLSLDELVLNDVYQYHLPPVRRIPPLLWTRIRSDFPNYLVEREADAINVVNWYHRQFSEASRDRYFSNVNHRAYIHSQMADYFIGMWGGGKPKPFKYTEHHRMMFNLTDLNGEADRKVPAQPLGFTDANGNVIRYNLRKLNELPHHLVRARRVSDLFDETLFNYKFLVAKLSCMPLSATLSDFEETLEAQHDRDVKILSDALRLSSSVLSHYPDNLAPQIIGRLLPYNTKSHPRLRDFIIQCDTDGIRDCALLPAYPCLHTPGGPLEFSLEGHAFAVNGIAISNFLISASNKFILFDLRSGEVARTVNPGIEGIMQNFFISQDGKHSISYTNNNQLVICSILTGEFKVFAPKMPEDIQGTSCNDVHFCVWSNTEWRTYDWKCKQIQSGTSKLPYFQINIAEDGKKEIVTKAEVPVKTGDETEYMTLSYEDGTDSFHFHSALTLSNDKQRIYACIDISDNDVAVYQLKEHKWKYDHTLDKNTDRLFALKLSNDETYLVGAVIYGFKCFYLKTDQSKQLLLPTGVRNIQTGGKKLTSLVEFSRDNQYIVGGVRNNIYVWDTSYGTLLRTLDAHFGRIVCMVTEQRGAFNKVISAAMDKTIKVWNLDNILEETHSIERLEKPIESIDVAGYTDTAISMTRNQLAVWDLVTGKVKAKLALSPHGAIITHATLTSTGKFAVCAESGKLIIWDTEDEKPIAIHEQKDILQLLLNDDDNNVIAISKLAPPKALCRCFTVLTGDKIYEFEFEIKAGPYRRSATTSDELFLAIVTDVKKEEHLSIYHAKTGTFLHNIKLSYANMVPFTHLVTVRHNSNQVAIMDPSKGNIMNVKDKKFVRSVNRWNGAMIKTGKLGIYAPTRGGLELLDMKTGETVMTLIPKVAEGVHDVIAVFSETDEHVLYYHQGHRSLRVFRVSDGKRIANFKCPARVSAVQSTEDGRRVVLGCEDGSLTVLIIADPNVQDTSIYMKGLKSRQVKSATSSRH